MDEGALWRCAGRDQRVKAVLPSDFDRQCASWLSLAHCFFIHLSEVLSSGFRKEFGH